MSRLEQIAADYLSVRRSLGYKLERQGRQLGQLVRYLEGVGAETVTVQHALAWATQPSEGSVGYWSDRLSVARQFAIYLRTLDPSCEVPPARLLPPRRRRTVPYLYTTEEIEALMTATGRLRGQLHRATMQTLIGLMATTGMRVGETIKLDRDHLDPGERLLRVIDGKFGKSREVALHDSTLAALNTYGELRDRLCPAPASPAFFVSRNGTRLLSQVVHLVFRRLTDQAGLNDPGLRHPPRLHDFRHSFAVNTLLGWHADGADVQSRLPLLSTYLGHVEPASTYHYLTAAPQLLAVVAQRLEPAAV